MIEPPTGNDPPTSKADDDTYPVYSMGAAADILDVEPAFLRALGTGGLLQPGRSDGGHRRYSRRDLDLAARAREIVNEGMTLAAACRIVTLEQQLLQAQAAIALLQRHLHEQDASERRTRRGK
jgi:MerR family transcriptional regulator, heat shock protein HspR